MNNIADKRKRGRPSKKPLQVSGLLISGLLSLVPQVKKKREFKYKCPMCEDLNKSKILNVNKITTKIDLKPIIVEFT